MASTCQSQEPVINLELANDTLANASSSSKVNHDDDVENAPKFYSGKSPVKFDFHFPDEVWQLILNQLTEDEDRTNCCRAFPLFDKLLTKSKPLWMFKQILPFIYEDYLETRDLLTCRRICKQWCDDIEHHITTQDRDFIHFHDSLYVFENVEDIDCFTKTLGGHAFNTWSPFITKYVCIELFGEDEFHTKLLEFLSEFGNHIGSLKLSFYWSHSLAEYRLIHQILTMTSKLTDLNLEIWGVDRKVIIPSGEYALPLIPTMETFNISRHTTCEVPASFLNILLPGLAYSSSKVKNIRIPREAFSRMFSHEFPKLVNLQIEEVTGDEELEKLLGLTSPLKKLVIKGPSTEKYEYFPINIATLLRVIQHFPLLEKVTVDSQTGFVETSVDFSNSSNFSNSTVRKFKLRYTTCYRLPSLNFLQGFKALEKLKIYLSSAWETHFCREKGERDIELFKLFKEGSFYESDIWRLIPSLKTVHIERRMPKTWIIGGRKGHENYQAGRLQN